MFDLHHLKQFLVVAEELHFSRAAKRLNIAQPPLSQAIKRLEERMGAVLFERNKRNVSLTPAGEMLQIEARRLLASAQRTREMVKQSVQGNDGHITIGFVSAALYKILPAALRDLQETYPDADISLKELTTNQQIMDLRQGSIDVGICHPPVTGEQDLTISVISRDPLMAALPLDHPLAKHKTIHFDELIKQAFVLFPETQGPNLYAAIVRACHQFGGTLKIASHARRIHTQLSLVAGGLGVTLVPESAKTIQIDGVCYKKINHLPQSLYLDLALAYYQTGERPLLQSVVAALHACGTKK